MYKDINVAVGGPVNADYPKVYKTKFLKPGIPFGLQVTDTDTKYVIKYNFDLGGESVTILSGCLIEFDGGLLSNGTIVGQDTIMIYHQEIDDILKNIILSGTFTIASSIDTLPPQEGKSGKFLTTDGEDAYWEDIPEQVTVDQTYDAASQNPQSGVAVAEGLANKQDVIEDIANIRSGASAGATAYQKPGTGIPKTDMSDDVQASLEKANTAIQEHQDISGKADKSTTLAGYGIADAYTKTEIYNKTEVNELVSTPHQNYVTVATKEDLDDIVTGGTASDDTIYRVSSYDFTANGGAGDVDVTKYSEYAYNGSVMVPLTVKSQVNEIFDISEYHSGAKYADLKEALGTGGANVPQSLHRGGMIVKYVDSTTDKYVQCRLTKDTWSIIVSDWQGVDEKPVSFSHNLIESGAVAAIQTRIDGATKAEVDFTASDNAYFPIGNATIFRIKAKNLSDEGSYLGVRFVDDNDNVIANVGDILISSGSTWQNGYYTSQLPGMTKIKFVKVYGNSFEIEVSTDDSLKAEIDKNTSDIASLDSRVQESEDAIQDIVGISKHNIAFSSSVTAYYVELGNANRIFYEIKNTNQHDAYIGIRFVDDNDNVIADGGNIFIAQDGTYSNSTARSQITGATNIKFVKVYGNDFEVTITTDESLTYKVNKNTSDISALNNSVAQIDSSLAAISQKVTSEDIPTDKFGYINANGGISVQTSGNNHMTDYVPVGMGSRIYYKGTYPSSSFSAVYGYGVNKDPIEQLLATGTNKEETIEITNPNIKYIVAWGDVSRGELKVASKALYDLSKLGAYEVVDVNGNGDYTTLEDAIWGNISDRGDVSKHRTILVMPGTYTMNTYYGNTARFWQVIEDRNLSIIGVDRNACILKNTKGKYIAGANRVDDACLKLSGNVLIKNLTLLSSHENFDGATGTSPNAYCIHLDSGGAGSNLEIDNCIMINKQQACIGIGTADNYTIQIRNCKLVTEVDNPSSFGSWSGAIVCHNTTYTNSATLRLENNIMKSNTPNTLSVVRSGSATSAIKLEAYRNIIGGNISIDLGIVTLDELNYGNNKSELNS